jgi:hypothetical protein
LLDSAYEEGRKDAIEDLFTIEQEKWDDAIHCTCMGYALVELSGGEDSAEGQVMQERLLEARKGDTPVSGETK